jgi:predicted kinase
MGRLRILRGISGSGKSTYAKENYPWATICSADDYFMKDGEYVFDFTKLSEAHRSCFVAVDFLLGRGDDVVLDNTNTQLWEMSPYVMLAAKHRVEVEIIRIACDPVIAAARNTHGVPTSSVISMDRRMEKLPPFWPQEEVVGPFQK